MTEKTKKEAKNAVRIKEKGKRQGQGKAKGQVKMGVECGLRLLFLGADNRARFETINVEPKGATLHLSRVDICLDALPGGAAGFNPQLKEVTGKFTIELTVKDK